LKSLRLLLLFVAVLGVGTTSASAASFSVGFSADPTEDVPVTVTVDGTADASRSLWVVRTTGGSCAATLSGNADASELSSSYYGDSVSAGPFTRSYAFTPSEATTYRVCAYLGQSRNGPNDATATESFTARVAAASVNVTVSPAARVNDRVAITVTGTSEVSRSLWVTASTSGCPATVQGTEISSSFYGDTLSAGGFVKSYSFGIPSVGAWSICAYVGQGRASLMDATGAAAIQVSPSVGLAVEVPAVVGYGQTVPIALKGYTNRETYLYAYVLPGTGSCPSARADAAAKSTTVIYDVKQPPGQIGVPASFGPATPGPYRVCAYAIEDPDGYRATLDATASGAFVIEEDPAFFVTLSSDDGHTDRDRLVLRWRQGPAGSQDAVRLYDRQPTAGSAPMLEAAETDTANLDVDDSGDVRVVKVRRHLGYGKFWWNIKRTAAGGRVTFSATQSVRVVPRPLRRAAARVRATRKLGATSRKPGSVRVAVFSSPLAKVTLRVTRGGRTVMRKAWTETVGGARSVTFRLSCARAGTFRYVVTMKDPYGTSVSRKGSWSLPKSRCAALRRREAAKRAAAERKRQQRAADERRQQQAEDEGGSEDSGGGSDGGGEAGCDGDPQARPYPTFPGQRDGDGDGCYNES
jgi:hypothetical protein